MDIEENKKSMEQYYYGEEKVSLLSLLPPWLLWLLWLLLWLVMVVMANMANMEGSWCGVVFDAGYGDACASGYGGLKIVLDSLLNFWNESSDIFDSLYHDIQQYQT